MDKKRIGWVDVSKGIGIILVIIGHTVDMPLIRGAIYSFHMPLFFILSGFSVNYSKNINEWKEKSKKSFKKLVIPGISLYIINFRLWDFLIDIYHGTLFSYSTSFFYTKLKEMVLSIIWASGAPVFIDGVTIYAIGIPWFLIVLFSARTLLDLFQLKLNDKYLGLVTGLMAVIGIVISKYIWLPFSFDVTLAVLIYIYIGKILKNVNLEKNCIAKSSGSLIIWGGSLIVEYYFTHSYAELACRRYTLFPLCYIIALMGTFSLTFFAMSIQKYAFTKKFLEVIGRNSMSLLCIHIIDRLGYLWLLKKLVNPYLVCVVRLIINLVLLYLLKTLIKLYTQSKNGKYKCG